MRPALLVLASVASFACGGPATGSPADPPGGGEGGGSGGQGSGGGAAGAASASLERIDEGGDCAGLVPAGVPAPLTLRRSPPAGASCIGGTSDGTGAVVVGAREPDGATRWQAYARDGTPRASFRADAPLVPEPSGWHGLVSSGPQGAFDTAVEHVAFAPDGSAGHRETVTPDPTVAAYPRWNLAPDPAGGCLVSLRWSALAGNHWSSVGARRLDASGRPAWPGIAPVTTDSSASEPMFLAGGVSVSGEALVLSQDSAFLDASWLDARTGAALPGATADQAERSGEVVGETLQPALELVPLLDGALAVRADGTFRRTYPRLATVSSPLPAWLAERATSTLRFTRGNAGYAALPPAGQPSPDCTQRVDLVSRSGRLCGRVVLREEASGCTSGAVDQGWDGTVVQQSGKDACTYRYWPGLLGR